MSLNWSDYESYTLGNRNLDSFLGQRDPIAFFTSRTDPEAKPRLIELVAAGGEIAERVQASWRRAKELSHEHLLRPYEIGASTLDGIPVIYAVLDLPDDDLSEILAKRSLESSEARSIVSSVKSGLDYLHERGLCHGAVAPGNIFFVGNTLKLGIDGISAADASCKEADLRQLRVRVAQPVSAKTATSIPAGAATGISSHLPKDLPEPFAAPLSQAGGPENRQGGGSRLWLWAAAVIVALFLAGVFLSRAGRHQPAQEATGSAARLNTVSPSARVTNEPAQPSEQAQAEPSQAERAQAEPEPAQADPAPTAEPPRAAEPPPTAVPPVQPSAPRPEPADNAQTSASPAPWAVIAATYVTFDDAQRRAEAIHKQHPQLSPRVVPPAGKGRHYFVVLGSGLTQKAAESLRREAVSLGIPRDTYVTKLDES